MRCFGVRRRVLPLGLGGPRWCAIGRGRPRGRPCAPQSRLQVAQTTDDAAATATKKPSEQTDQTAKVPASSDHPDDASLSFFATKGPSRASPSNRQVTASSPPREMEPLAFGTRIQASPSASRFRRSSRSTPPSSIRRASGSSPHHGTRPRASGTPKPASQSASRWSMMI